MQTVSYDPTFWTQKIDLKKTENLKFGNFSHVHSVAHYASVAKRAKRFPGWFSRNSTFGDFPNETFSYTRCCEKIKKLPYTVHVCNSSLAARTTCYLLIRPIIIKNMALRAKLFYLKN